MDRRQRRWCGDGVGGAATVGVMRRWRRCVGGRASVVLRRWRRCVGGRAAASEAEASEGGVGGEAASEGGGVGGEAASEGRRRRSE